MHDLLIIALAILAVARLATMITVERGPFDVFSRVRGAASMQFGEDHWITDGLNCSWCVSFWLALVAAVAIAPLLALPLAAIVLTWLGIAGGAWLILAWLGVAR